LKRTLITTVTLNAAIDKTYFVPAFEHGIVSRVEKALSTAGGKGLNVARVLRQLGQADVAATGFAGGYNGKFITSKVEEAGIAAAFVECAGESRICLNVIDGRDGSSTELLEPGPEIGEAEMAALKRKLARLSAESAVVVFSGSLPKGVPLGAYAELIALSREAGAEVFLDTSGEALALGTAALPSFVKPNEDEIAALLPKGKDGDLRDGIASLMERGLSQVVVTLGGEGAVAGIRGRLYRVRIPPVRAVSAVGSGDAFVAGYAYGQARGWPAEDVLKFAAAAGSANAMSPLTGDVDAALHRGLLSEITVEEWRT